MTQLSIDRERGSLISFLRAYQSLLADEAEWDARFRQTSELLALAAQQVRRSIAEGEAAPMNWDRL